MQFEETKEVIERSAAGSAAALSNASEKIFAAIAHQESIWKQFMSTQADNLAQLTAITQDSSDSILAQQSRSESTVLQHLQQHHEQSTQLLMGISDGLKSVELGMRDGQDRAMTKLETSVADRIVASLRFSDIRLRRDTIPSAHQRTFEWIFQAETSPFKDWLQSSESLFWVRGKAGSGKSTLMKYLTGNPLTQDLLQGWAGTRPLAFVEFYFWYLGSSLQRNEEGLLRSILYQILRACRALIPIAASRRWSDSASMDDSWTLEELREAIVSVAKYNSAYKFCFFVDGLDEYDADRLQLVKWLKSLSLSPHFKLCVSSRPWPEFENGFAFLTSFLTLQDLTRSDIKRYVHDNLEEYCPKMPDSGGLERDRLVATVATKAEGVFLWVYLTVRSLQEGLVATA